ncbi:MAG: hypothetical protein CR975_04600 [Gammaproteobacteria bacterium]|nr:MAG: hypothetical protein CR975_04600 [Gammaproteobacteria bacterium]
MKKILWLGVYFSVLIWSAIHPKDGLTWFLEVIPALIGLLVLFFIYPRFRFSALTYNLILVHCLILMVGGHYTYAEVPLFDSLSDIAGWQRNNYDKIGHLAQGFVPAAIAREVFIRLQVIHNDRWRNFLVICFCLALSAFYELLEWWAALATGESAEAFLGTQGYQWDTQSDMLWALIGAMGFVVFFSKWQQQSIARKNNIS